MRKVDLMCKLQLLAHDIFKYVCFIDNNGKDMRASYWNVIIVAAVIIFLLNSVAANMMPTTFIDEGMTPVPDSDTPLYLKSEDLVFTLGTKLEPFYLMRSAVEVDGLGNFTISNPTNRSIQQAVLFPFDTKIMTAGFGKFSFRIISLQTNGVDIEYKNTTYRDDPSIIFNITVKPYEDLSVIIHFITYAISNDFNTEFNYITITGKEWGRPIEHAFFKFIINGSLIGGDLEGIDNVFQENGFTIGTLEHSNWTPEENIKVKWNNPYYYEYYSRPRVHLIYPLDNSITADYKTTLVWNVTCFNSSMTTIHYDVYLSTNISEVNELKDKARIARNITALTFDAYTIHDLNTYYWTVRPHANGTYGSCESGIWEFELDTCPCYIEMKIPHDDAVINQSAVDLGWSNYSNCIYDVYFGTNEYDVTEKKNSVKVADNLTKNTFTVEDLVDGEVYYWTVVVNEGLGWNQDGVWNFTAYLDSDGDGVRDSEDAYPDDPGRTEVIRDTLNGNQIINIVCMILWYLSPIIVFLLLVFITYRFLRKKPRVDK